MNPKMDIRPMSARIDEAVEEYHLALQDFAEIEQEELEVRAKKDRAHKHLSMARDELRAIEKEVMEVRPVPAQAIEIVMA
jgi:hypothetical protein